MVCEFLPPAYKRRLLEIVTVNDLLKIGYTRHGAYKAIEKKIISDEMCEELIKILGDRARDILIEALHEFASQLKCAVNC
jgi:hypothetical protein